jgi:hypothetical protein
MSLSEIIAGLNQGECVGFTRFEGELQFIVVKVDSEGNRREIARHIDEGELRLCRIDILAAHLRRAIEILRRSEATTDAN